MMKSTIKRTISQNLAIPKEDVPPPHFIQAVATVLQEAPTALVPPVQSTQHVRPILTVRLSHLVRPILTVRLGHLVRPILTVSPSAQTSIPAKANIPLPTRDVRLADRLPTRIVPDQSAQPA